MKIIFIAAVEIGYKMLETIYGANYSVDTVYTLPLSMQETTSGFTDFSPLTEQNNSHLIRTCNINDKSHIDEIKEINPDLVIVCGWQRLICEDILKIPKMGVVGFHSSILPKYRGRAPVNWAIIMGEKKTGITMFYLTPQADDGDIIAQKSFPILLNDDCSTVYKKSAQAGADLIIEYLPKIENGIAPRTHNPSSSYPVYPKRTPSDGLIDFNRSALDVYNFIRALTKPYPGAYYLNETGEKIIVWKSEIIFDEANCNDEYVVVQTFDFKIRLITE